MATRNRNGQVITVAWLVLIACLLVSLLAGPADSGHLGIQSAAAGIRLDLTNLLLGLCFALGFVLAYLQLRGRDR